MARDFRVKKIPLESLISLLLELYEKGIDYVDLTSDYEDPTHDKLIIVTKDSYINPDYHKNLKEDEEDEKGSDYDIDDDDDDDDDDEEDGERYPFNPPTPRGTSDNNPTTLSDDDINELL